MKFFGEEISVEKSAAPNTRGKNNPISREKTVRETNIPDFRGNPHKLPCQSIPPFIHKSECTTKKNEYMKIKEKG